MIKAVTFKKHQIMNYKKYLPDSLCKSSNDTSKIVGALLAGVAIGAAIGILFAPDSGSEIRSQISDKAKDLAGSVKDRVQSAKESLQNKANDYKEDLKDVKDQVVNTAKSKFGNAADDAASASKDV